MATGGDDPADNRSGINFGVELDIPWSVSEAYVDLNSDGIYDLATVPDVIGLHTRRQGAPVVKVLFDRDPRSVRAWFSDPDVPYQDFHDVTIVDMENTTGPTVSVAELSLLRLGVNLVQSVMAPAGPGTHVDNIKESLPECSGSCLFVLQEMDQVGHTSSCGSLSLGTCSAVALPCFVVYCMEGDAA